MICIMVRIIVKGKPGDYYKNGRVKWDGKVVGTVVEVKPNGDAVCEVDSKVYEELFATEFASMGCSFADIN